MLVPSADNDSSSHSYVAEEDSILHSPTYIQNQKIHIIYHEVQKAENNSNFTKVRMVMP